MMFAAAVVLSASALGAGKGVSKEGYLELVEAAVSSYSDGHINRYISDVERDGVQEHGFPRLAANLALLVANGRMSGKRDVLKRMMDICCEWAPKGKMKFEGNEFSVKELAVAISELEHAKTFPKSTTDVWRAGISAVDAEKCYRVQLPAGHPKANNWLIFGCASEQVRIALGMGGDAKRVEKYVADQLRWFDANGMYKDPNQPAVYDLVTRLQFMLILHYGYDGPSRAKLEELLDRSAGPTLAMLSAGGEIPYGGRSNQFLHNHTFYSAVCEWYAARYGAKGEKSKAAKFRLAARGAADALRRWLAVRPVRHVKNLYPRDEGIRVAGVGCEGYAYFDKYMITMGSWAALAYLFADESVPACPESTAPSSFATTPDFHMVFLSAGEYSAQFDYSADIKYDCDGMGRLQRRGAPEAICMSTPCALKPKYRTETPNGSTLSFVPLGDGVLKPVGNGHDSKSAWADWTHGGKDWKCRLTEDGIESVLTGPGDVAMQLPAFAFDGEEMTEISPVGKSLTVRYKGWVCVFLTDGKIVDTGKSCCNRNGRYRIFKACGEKKLTVKIWIRKETVCVCGEAPGRRNDFYWENDRTGFRAYGPADAHKWSGIDVYNKATAANMVCRFFTERGKFGNWHKNLTGLGMDNYTVGPGRGLGGVALRRNGKWLADYGNWFAYRVLESGDDRCSFELDYRLPIGGVMTLGITLPRGSSFFKETVSFSKDVPLDGIEVGVGIDLNPKRGHGGGFFIDEDRGIVSIFENPYNRRHEEGSLMSALFVKPGTERFVLADEPNGSKMIMTPPLKASDANGRPVLTVFAGADWTEAGRRRTADEWHDHVKKVAGGFRGRNLREKE